MLALTCILALGSPTICPDLPWQRETEVIICVNEASAEKWALASLFILHSAIGTPCSWYPVVYTFNEGPVSITSNGKDRSIVVYRVTIPNTQLILDGHRVTLTHDGVVDAYMLKEVHYVAL